MNKKLFFMVTILSVLFFQGCAVSVKINEGAMRQIIASTPKSEGEIKYTTIGHWIPNNKEFLFMPRNQLPIIKGVIVITDKSILFEQWGGEKGLTIIKNIQFKDILEPSLITLGRSARIVILRTNEQYDSFAVSDNEGLISLGAETTDMYDILLPLLKR